MAISKILFMDEQKQKQLPHGEPKADWEIGQCSDGEVSGDVASGNNQQGKDNMFDFDAFADMLGDEELLDAMQQHQKKQSESQRREQQKQEEEQKDIDELCSFATAKTNDASDKNKATVVSEQLAPPPPVLENTEHAELALVPELEFKTDRPNPIVQEGVQGDTSPCNKQVRGRSPQEGGENCTPETNNSMSEDHQEQPVSEEPELESFISEDTDESKSEVVVDIESLSARQLAAEINSNSLYSLHAVKQLLQYRHLRAAIRNIRIKHEGNLDFERLAQLVEDSQVALSPEDSQHLQLFERSLQKFLTNLFDYVYVIGKVGSDSEISQLVAVEYEDFFETMTGLTRQEFTQLCAIGVFNGQELMSLIKTFHSWCTKTMSAESFILYHTSALREVG